MSTSPVRPRCWDTASSCEPADSFPMELDALGHHLVQCGPLSAPWPALRRASRTVVVVDVVESVRLMEQDEDDTIRRWQSFVGEVVTRLLPQHGGREIDKTDGFLLLFGRALDALAFA